MVAGARWYLTWRKQWQLYAGFGAGEAVYQFQFSKSIFNLPANGETPCTSGYLAVSTFLTLFWLPPYPSVPEAGTLRPLQRKRELFD